MMRQRMKFAAVLVVVVLALTGFSTSHSGGKGGKSRSGKSSSSGGGGGCSSSKKSNHDYDDYDSSSSSSSGGTDYGTPTPGTTASDAPDVRVIRCAQPRKGKRKAVTSSVVEIRSKVAGTDRTYEIDVTFLDAVGRKVDSAQTTATLGYGDVKSLTVRMDSPRKVSRVKRCQVTAVARP
ncbi:MULTISPECIES: hypothetical protein [unclassified Streptomyces]|uniref:hypothetical protein n=1 Tax=unclassified Streptomyces TaxID=2593676 RepID=UPI00093BE8BC|nr:hypothetical protein [Streptomyces sp. TSRI0281]OKI48227.1 hypothetical protein A6A29_04120 [Streptomyces sp. TSRI0281]